MENENNIEKFRSHRSADPSDFDADILLGRDPLSVLDDASREFYRSKTVLVTGGGGSIGSELCRQVAECQPKRIVIFDIYENNAFLLEEELKRKWGESIEILLEIGSVRDRERMEHIFRRYRPEVVFHAAAHKHVHLMERAPGEAIKNNCLGTYIAADMAEKYGTERFILISTDKAVRPTGIMGASKRFCELAVECRRDSHTVFSAVRFGNVIGSRGSVVPLFLRQIKEGGPITITDKRMMRYFMSVSEAVGLVMQAGVMAERGELFVLDMGRPVSILALAEKMIRLSGLEPYRDIDIVEIGLRRGERLFEELLLAGESVEMTSNRMIYIERDKPLGRDRVDELMTMLLDAISEEDENTAARVRAVFKQAVPEYTPLCD